MEFPREFCLLLHFSFKEGKTICQGGYLILLSFLKKEKEGKASNEIQLIGLSENTISFSCHFIFRRRRKYVFDKHSRQLGYYCVCLGRSSILCRKTIASQQEFCNWVITYLHFPMGTGKTSKHIMHIDDVIYR